MSHYRQEWRAGLGEDGLSGINKFGYSTGITTSEFTVWGDASVYSYPAAAAVMKVTSASTVDQAGSTGALTVTVQGLDANYAEITDTVNLNGSSSTAPALTTNLYLRINRAFVATAGAAEGNVGAVYVGTGAITTGKPANLHAVLPSGESQTLQANYTVPADKSLLMTALKFSTSAVAKVVTARLISRGFGGVFRIRDKFNLPAGAIVLPYDIPKMFDEKTDIQMRAITSVGTETTSASFDGALVPNEGA